MSINNPSESFAGFAMCFILAGLVCLPILGWYSLAGVAGALYFGLVLLNGADSAAKRSKQKNKHRRR
jgi:hypothetical protein